MPSSRALLCLVSLMIGAACVDLSPPWTKGSPMTGGSSGSSLDTDTSLGGNLGGNTADAASPTGRAGNGGASNPGGSGATGGIAIRDAWGTGDAPSTGGGVSATGPSGGVTGSGGATPSDSPVASGGAGGALALGGNSNTDATAVSGGASSPGGALGTGGNTRSDGSPGSGGSKEGGSPMTGGTTTTGGTSATGGMVGTGGTSTAVCGTAKSTFSETVAFTFLDGGTSPLALSPSPAPVGAQLGYTTTGPASNPSLCNAGCATLSMAFTSGMASYKGLSAIQSYVPAINLVGATIAFAIAIDNPGVPIQVQVYATGDASTGSAWATPTTISGSTLTSYAAANGFKDLSLAPINGTTNKYCASASATIGLQMQNTTAITSSNAGTVTIYISKIAVRPPA